MKKIDLNNFYSKVITYFWIIHFMENYPEHQGDSQNVHPSDIDPAIFDSEDYTTDLDKVKVKGSVVMTAIDAFPNHSSIIMKLLKSKGIEFVYNDNWYPLEKWLECLNEIERKFSKIILFEMGEKIMRNAVFPSQIKTMYDVLFGLNVAYHLNHRSGRIGYYRLEEFNNVRKYAIMKCHTPYNSEYEKGALQGIGNKFLSSESSFTVSVSLLKMKEPSKTDGGTTNYFKIKW